MALSWEQAMAQLNPSGAGLGISGVTNQPTGVGVDGGYLQTYDPNATSGGGTTSGGGSNVNSQAVAQFDQSIKNTQAAIDRLGAQLNSGYSGIDASYQNALNQLLLGKNQSETAYNDNKHTTALGYVAGKNTVGSNAGNTLNSLRRLLGMRGAGGSSAATVTAPEAVTRQATLQRGELGNTFGANNKALDTNWNEYLTGYNNQVSSAANQREQQRQSLNNQIETNRASLLQTLAQLAGQRAAAAGGNATGAAQPYLDQANAVLDRAANYTINPITYQTQAYKAPSLASYTTNPNAAPTVQGQAANNDYFSPYLQTLLGKKQTNTGAV